MGLFSRWTGKRRSPPLEPVESPARNSRRTRSPATPLRAEAPVLSHDPAAGGTGWLVTRYDDVAMVLKDERFVKDTANALTPEQAANRPWFRKLKSFKSLQRNMLNLDPPDHTRLRALVSKAFTPRLIEQMRERSPGADRRAARRRSRPRAHGSDPRLRPAAADDDHRGDAGRAGGGPPQFHRWSNALVGRHFQLGMVKAIPNVSAFMRYIRKIIKHRRADPQDDLVSALVQAEEAGDTLSEDELVAMIILLLVAGHETTVNLIGNGTLALLEHPDQMEKLRNDPALIKPAVEELLRFTSPVEMATERYAREDVTIAGVTIPRGEMVFAVIASANRDERQFPNPDTLDITREPNKHLTFGLGTHFCLGRVARPAGGADRDQHAAAPPAGSAADALRPMRCAGGPGWCCAAWNRCRWRI